jgi:Arc/MetJ family transcription regulator
MLGAVSRTNIDIDDELLARAMERYGYRTKREAVNEALRQLVGDPMTRDEMLAMEGMGWGDGIELSDLRDDPSRLP